MTRNQFKMLLIRLCPRLETDIVNNITSLPRLLTEVAAYCFIYNVGDSGDVQEFKRQFLILEKTGCFDFEGES